MWASASENKTHKKMYIWRLIIEYSYIYYPFYCRKSVRKMFIEKKMHKPCESKIESMLIYELLKYLE